MKFGLFYLPTYLPDQRDAHTHMHNIVEQVEYADKIGIDYVWMVEHHFVRHGGFLSAIYAFLSYLDGRTQNIRLATGATVMALNDPVRVAEHAATLDQLSNGRFDLGVGRGFIRDEFDSFGVPMRESRERVEEGVALVRKAWSGQPLEFKSRFRPDMSGLPVLPPTLQNEPKIWNACLMSPESFEWTAQEGHNLLYVAYHVDHERRRSGYLGTAKRCPNMVAKSKTTWSATSITPTSWKSGRRPPQSGRGRPYGRVRRCWQGSGQKATGSGGVQGVRSARQGHPTVDLRPIFPGPGCDGWSGPGGRTHPRTAHWHHAGVVFARLWFPVAG